MENDRATTVLQSWPTSHAFPAQAADAGQVASTPIDAVGRFRFVWRRGTPAVHVLSHPETGARSRRDVAAAVGAYGAVVAWMEVGAAASGACRPAALVSVPRGAAQSAREIISTLAASHDEKRDDDDKLFDAVAAHVARLEQAKVLASEDADRIQGYLIEGADERTLRRLARAFQTQNRAAVARSLRLLAAKHLPAPTAVASPST